MLILILLGILIWKVWPRTTTTTTTQEVPCKICNERAAALPVAPDPGAAAPVREFPAVTAAPPVAPARWGWFSR